MKFIREKIFCANNITKLKFGLFSLIGAMQLLTNSLNQRLKYLKKLSGNFMNTDFRKKFGFITILFICSISAFAQDTTPPDEPIKIATE